MKNISDIVSSLSVLLIFLTFLLNVIKEEINEKLKEGKPPKTQKKARKLFNESLIKLLIIKLLPIVSIFLITFYILLPKTFEIIKHSKIVFWDIDELRTIFVFVELGLLGLVIFSLSRIFNLVNKIRDKN